MKNYSISIVRSIAICMIVSCHIFQGLDIELAYWLNAGVQIFLCMSGYLYGKKNIENVMKWYIRQYLKIMVPVWVLLTCLLIIIYTYQMETIPLTSVVFSYLGIAGFNTIPEVSHTWFITYILFCYLITPLLQAIDISSIISECRFFVYLVSIILVIEVLYLGKIINIMPQYVVCYIIGYYLSRREQLLSSIDRIKTYMFLFTGITVLLLPGRLLIQYGRLKIENSLWSIIRSQILDWHHLLVGISLFLILLRLFERKKIKPNSYKVINYLDKYSYYIYLVHQIFILNTFSLLRVTRYLSINLIIIMLAIIVSAFVLERISGSILIRLSGSRKNKN